MQAFKKFLLTEIIFTISIGFISSILFQGVVKNYYLPVFWVLLAVITILTGALHYTIVQVSEKETSKFTSRFLMVFGSKMMIYLILITSFVFLNPGKAKVFLIYFFILYILYTTFEVISILKYFKNIREVDKKTLA